MNPSVALLVTSLCALSALWSVVGTLTNGRVVFSSRLSLLVMVSVLAWIVGGLATWGIGNDAPARPGVFLGYAATGVALALLGMPAVGAGRLGPRGAGVCRAMVLALLAFVCWRTESVWLVGVPVSR